MFSTTLQKTDEGKCFLIKLYQLVNENKMIDYHYFATFHQIKDLGIGQQLMLTWERIQTRKDVPPENKQMQTYTHTTTTQGFITPDPVSGFSNKCVGNTEDKGALCITQSARNQQYPRYGKRCRTNGFMVNVQGKWDRKWPCGLKDCRYRSGF